MGTLSNYSGVESVEIELPDGACYNDLLKVVGERYGAQFPKKCWDSDRGEFKKPISAIGTNGDIDDRDAPLAGHKEIHFLIPVSGG